MFKPITIRFMQAPTPGASRAARRAAIALFFTLLLAPPAVASPLQDEVEPPPRQQPALVESDATAPWRATAKTRTSISLSLHLASEIATIAFLAWLFLSGRAASLRARVERGTRRRFFVDAGVIVAVFTLARLVAFPFDAARFALARSYGIVHLPLGAWLSDLGSELVVNLASAVFIGSLFYLVVRRRPQTWWRWVTAAALPFAIASVAATPLYMSLFNTFAPLADRPLATEILELAARVGVPADEVYVVDFSRQTRAANAFVTGVGPTATIALSDTLLDKFADEEVLFVMAHEMGHYVHHHLWIGIAAATLLTALGAFALQRLLGWATRRWRERSGVDELGDVASFPLVVAAVSVLTLAGLPVASTISRQIETDADRFAIEMTVPGEVSSAAAVSAFERLGELALSDPAPNPLVRFVFWSHPSLDERIARVRAAARAPAP
jgi:Zn-dependent protease with chaperone function